MLREHAHPVSYHVPEKVSHACDILGRCEWTGQRVFRLTSSHTLPHAPKVLEFLARAACALRGYRRGNSS
jgi:hypothetical protein